MGISLERILCPTDFSEFADFAIRHASALARAFGAHLVALHVMPQTLMHPELFPYLDKPLVPEPDIEGRARARLESFAGAAAAAGVAPETRLIAGDPRTRIVAEAEKMGADLIVLGTHGRGGFVRFLLGSVAERVVRIAAGGVLTVSGPPPSTSGSILPYRRILAAVDFSADSSRALAYARAFQRKAGGELILLHVVEPWAIAGGSARERIEETLASTPGDVEGVEILVVDDAERADHGIQRVAEERAVDLLVAGATGAGNPGPCEPGFLSSTARALLQSPSYPVLTVRRRVDLPVKEEK